MVTFPVCVEDGKPLSRSIISHGHLQEIVVNQAVPGASTFSIVPGDEPIVGKLGVVTHPITPGRPGEIVVHIRGGTETYMAYADADLPVKTEVLVVARRSNRTVEVTAFSG